MRPEPDAPPPLPGSDPVGTTKPLPFPAAFRPVLLITGIFYLNFVPRVGMGPLMPVVELDLGISHAQAGSLFLLISLGYCLGLLGSGFVTARITHRRSVILSSLGVGAALLGVALHGDLWGLRVGMTVLGAAAGLYLPSGIATVTDLVTPSDWGKALATHEIAPNLSFFTAPLLAEALLHWLPWRGVLGTLGAGAVLGALLFSRYGRGGNIYGAPPSARVVRRDLGDPSLWILTALFSLALGASTGVYGMLPLYLVSDLGLPRASANTLVAFSRASGLVMLFAAGWLADHAGPRRTMTLVFTASGVLTALIGCTTGTWLVAAVFLQPMLAACFFPVGFAALARISPTAVSIAIPPAVLLGNGGIPAIMGLMASHGAFRGALLLVGAMILAGAALARLLPLPEAKRLKAVGTSG